MTDYEIEILQQENSSLKNELQQIKEDHKKQLSTARKDQALTLLLASFKTRFDELQASVRDSALKEIINTGLTADSAELSIDEGGQLILRKKDGSNFFGQDHRLLTPITYVENLMTRGKILLSADQGQTASSATNNNGREYSFQNRQKSNGSKSNNVLSALVDESLKGLSVEL